MESSFLVYTGEVEGRHKFRVIKSLEENTGITWEGFRRATFNSKLFKRGVSVGAIFPIEVDGESFSYKKDQHPIGIWKNQDDLLKARTQAAANQKQKEVLKELRINHLKEKLAPIREVYKNCSPNQKVMILAEIMKEITR
jgi:hypothetical protein